MVLLIWSPAGRQAAQAHGEGGVSGTQVKHMSRIRIKTNPVEKKPGQMKAPLLNTENNVIRNMIKKVGHENLLL